VGSFYQIDGFPDDGRLDRIIAERPAADLIVFLREAVSNPVNRSKF
jgi:hypothetical protein